MDYSSEPSSQMTILMDNFKDSGRPNDTDLWLTVGSHNATHNSIKNESSFDFRLNQTNGSTTGLVLSPQMIPDLLNITQTTPLEYAMVMYGYII